MEATPGFEPGHQGFADPRLTTWLCRHIKVKNSYTKNGADDEARPRRFACGTHAVTETFRRNVSLASLVPCSSLGEATIALTDFPKNSYTKNGADDEARTRYLHLGKVALYQMSYIRKING